MRPRGRRPRLAASLPALGIASIGALTAFEPAGSTAALTAARRPSPDEIACLPDGPRAVPLQLWVLPEAGSTPLVEAIGGAQESLRVMIYELGEGPILRALERKARSGVPVRVILDGARMEVNQPYHDRLVDAGAEVRWSSPRFAFTHAKTMIVDGAVAMISTGNYGGSFLETERNYVVRDADADDVDALVRVFDADWRSRRPDLRCTRLVLAPDNARERLLALIDGATDTLDVESTELSDPQVRAAIVERAAAGVAVRVILADPSWIEANEGAAAFFARRGIPVRSMVSPAVHVKAILVDGNRAFLGSENLSENSLSNNREIGLITLEPPVLATMAATFVKDWASATPF
jgi:phosphatidylserine/phosphatidylglycerophosphate/cardiolipin synthase-like enzyme